MDNPMLTALKAGKVILGCLYGPMKLRPVKNKITVLSRQSDEPTVDIALLDDYMRKNHPDVDFRVLCKKLEGGGKLSYMFHMLKQMWNISDSSVVLLDGYCIAASILKHRENLKIVQMWHALGAIKKFGYQTLGKEGGRSYEIAETMCMHRNYDFIIAPSRATGKLFCEAFDDNESKLIFMGLPRIDMITGSLGDSDGDEAELRSIYGIPDDKEIILYAPTFRKAGKTDISGVVEAVDPDRFVLVVCPHPMERDEELEGCDTHRGVIIDRTHSTYQWMPLCQRMITDYSAIAMEGAVAGKQVYFYVYDIEEYEEKEGLNIDPSKEIPLLTAKTAEELSELIHGDYPWDEIKKFRSRYVDVDTDNCTGRLCDFLVSI